MQVPTKRSLSVLRVYHQTKGDKKTVRSMFVIATGIGTPLYHRIQFVGQGSHPISASQLLWFEERDGTASYP
jgi:hypothetical protein